MFREAEPRAELRASSAWHAPAARDAERPSAGKGGRKGASASKDRRSERFGFTGATKELPSEAAAALANKKRYPFFRYLIFFVLIKYYCKLWFKCVSPIRPAEFGESFNPRALSLDLLI